MTAEIIILASRRPAPKREDVWLPLIAWWPFYLMPTLVWVRV